MTSQLVLLSGGLDSTVALAACEEPVIALSANYGQRHRDRELRAAASVAEFYNVHHYTLDLRSWGAMLPGGALTDARVDVPRTKYDPASMADTVVPNRNATLLMAAVGVAMAHGIDEVVAAVHGGDHNLYADCRPEFFAAAYATAQYATEGAVGIAAPFLHQSKADIVRNGDALAVPFELTWSCYNGGAHHCGVCGTCTERREAFKLAGVPDPTRYEGS